MKLDLSDKKRVFSKYDIRGIYPDQIDEELVGVVSKVLAEKIFPSGKIVVGHDARVSSPSLYATAIDALSQYEDVEIIEVGLITTPMLTFLIKHLEADGGITITASHNPKEYNGIKVAKADGDPVSGEEIYTLLT